MAAGRFAGPTMPNQPMDTMSSPCSRIVGTSGKAARRSMPVTAIAFIRPSRTSCATEEEDWNRIVTRLSIRSMFIWPDCVYGMWFMRSPVAKPNCAPARCCEDPAPIEP